MGRAERDWMSALRMEVWAIHCPGSWQELHGSELQEIPEQEIDKIISFETIEEFTMKKRLM